MAASYRFIVTGRVQGVGFRWSAVHQARQLGLSGWVRNRDDGAVEGHAQGEAAALDQLRAWLQRGPPAARVDSVEWAPAPGQPGAGFEART